MEHFIKEFNHLKWDNLVNLSTREHACLHRLHAELYGMTTTMVPLHQHLLFYIVLWLAKHLNYLKKK